MDFGNEHRTDTPATMFEIVHRWADRTPEAPVLVEKGRAPLTYAALADMAAHFGQSLYSHGTGRNDRIAVVHSGGADMAASIVGIWSCAAAVPLNPAYTAGEFAIYFRDLDVSAVLVESTLDSPARGAAERLGLPVFEVEQQNGDVAGMVRLAPGSRAVDRGLEPAELMDLATVLATSGTTSHSKTVPLRHRELWFKYANAVTSLELTPHDRCLNLMPLFHGHGINTGLGICLWSGGSTVMLPEFDIDTFADHIETLAPTWYTGSFTFHHHILNHAERLKPVIASSKIQFARSGSGPLDAEIGEKIEKALTIPVIQTYSTTETGMIASNPRPPRRRQHGSVGLPASDGVAIMGDHGEIMPPGRHGEVVVSGECVFEGYENDATANAAAFSGKWFRTGDQGLIDDDGYLFLTGRIKEIINRGGEKITPSEIEQVLVKHPEVATATVFPIPHATLGEEVAAVVVPEKGAVISDEILAQFVAKSLAGFKIPRRFVFVDSIPKGSTGKVNRRGLAAAFSLDGAAGTPSPEQSTPMTSATPLEATLQQLWAETLGVKAVGLHDDFFLLGGDSLQAVELFFAIEDQIGKRLPRSILFEAGTVAEMSARIAAETPSECIVPIQPDGDRPPFFCIHDQNGDVLNFRDLARHMGERQPFYGIQSVGLDGEAAPFIRMEDMASHYLREIRKIQPQGPYYIGGYSFGGRVAYAIAQQLRADNEHVGLLALLDTYYLAGRKNVGVRGWAARHRNRLAGLGASEIPGYLAQRLRNAGETLRVSVRARSVTAVWQFCDRRGLDIPRFLRYPAAANDIIRRTDRPQPYDGDVLFIQAELPAFRHSDIHEGWRRIVKGRFEVRPVPGRHYDFVKEPHVRTLAAELTQCLADRQDRNSAGPQIATDAASP
jgi:oxalate---CoA ligase